MNFYKIRIYGYEYDPDFFKKSGWRGWWVRVLNRLRFSLEMRCNYNAMLILSEKQGFDTQKIARQVMQDQQKVVDYIRKSKDLQDLSAATPAQLLKNSETVQERTKQTLARLTASGRSRRYRSARLTRPIYEAEVYTNESGQRAEAGNENRAYQHSGESGQTVDRESAKSSESQPPEPQYQPTEAGSTGSTY